MDYVLETRGLEKKIKNENIIKGILESTKRRNLWFIRS